jgi:hypothetical protein
MNISRNKIEEKAINLRRMEVWRLLETGIEKMLLYFIINENYIKQGATNTQQIRKFLIKIFRNKYATKAQQIQFYFLLFSR